jgi:predicted RNase H-like HicB family nuclease
MNANFVLTPTDHLSKLTYHVLIEEEQEGYKATVLGLPNCQTTGKTREAALTNLRNLLGRRLQKAEIVSLEIELSKPDHPWMKFAGKYKDDLQFDEMLDCIQAYRHELDAEMEDYDIQLDAEDAVE